MEGQMETTTDPRMRMFSDEQVREFEKASVSIRENMSPPGALGLPPLLEARRLEWGITDGAFDCQAAYDRILIFQIPQKGFEKGMYGGESRLIVPDNAQELRKRQAPRGIIVSAGLKALDELRSNGMELGDIVMFNHVAPWRVETDVIGGKMHYLLVMHTGHIIGSEDTAKRIRSGALKTEMDSIAAIHVYRDKNGFSGGVRTTPKGSEEY